jgi:hypothetical protein
MKRNTILILSMVMVFTGSVLAAPPVEGKYRSELEHILDDCIAACDSKAGLLDSKSEPVRRDAILACLKATYFRLAKASLIDELVAEKIAPDKYKVQCFIDNCFNQVVRNKKPDFVRRPWDRYGYFK